MNDEEKAREMYAVARSAFSDARLHTMRGYHLTAEWMRRQGEWALQCARRYATRHRAEVKVLEGEAA